MDIWSFILPNTNLKPWSICNTIQKELLNLMHNSKHTSKIITIAVVSYNDVNAFKLVKKIDVSSVLEHLIYSHSANMMRVLLREDINPELLNNYAITLFYNNNPAVARVVLADKRVDLSGYEDNFVIDEAIAHGYTENVRLLLAYTRSIPSNNSIVYASTHGYTEIVRMLLEDDRVECVEFTNEEIRRILRLKKRGVSVIKLLMTSEKVDF
jgi:hypothetical protein